MSELILHTIVEKLEHLESLLKRQDVIEEVVSQQALLSKFEVIEKQLKLYSTGAKISSDILRQVSLKIDACSNEMNQPSQGQIIHTHHCIKEYGCL